MSLFSEYDYSPNDIDSDRFLSDVPVSLMKENIKAQFKDPLENRKKDHISTFISMFNYSKDNYDVYEDEDLDNTIELKDEFYAYIIELFRIYLGIGFNDFEDLSDDEQNELIHYTYRFFIINIKKNFVCLILNYIEKHRDEYFDDDKKRDVTTLTFKREVTDPADVYILSNLATIINEILAEDIDVDDFFDNCDDNDYCLETRFVSKQFDEFRLTGNFVRNYIKMLDTDFISSIESKVRNRILKKYKKQ